MKTKPLVVLDPGHGSGPRRAWQGRGFDPGAVDQRRNITEAEANVEACLTLKYLLEQRGIAAVLTHTGQQGAKPDLSWRVVMAHGLGADALISVHFDMKFTPSRHLSGLYHAPGAASLRFAQAIRPTLRQGARSWLKPSTSSRFGALYIDAFVDRLPSVMLELDSIEYAPALGAAGRDDRLALLTPIADEIARQLNAA